MAGIMPSLDSVSIEWEATSELRTHMRKTQELLIKEVWENDLKVDVQHAVMNYSVLKPLVRRLVDSTGSVGMHSQPKIAAQFLAPKTCFPTIFVLHYPLFCQCIRPGTWSYLFNFCNGFVSPKEWKYLRIRALYLTMSIDPPSKDNLKKTAKKIKKFLVLIKRKLQKGQLCRSFKFRSLLALVHDPDEKDQPTTLEIFQGGFG